MTLAVSYRSRISLIIRRARYCSTRVMNSVRWSKLVSVDRLAALRPANNTRYILVRRHPFPSYLISCDTMPVIHCSLRVLRHLPRRGQPDFKGSQRSCSSATPLLKRRSRWTGRRSALQPDDFKFDSRDGILYFISTVWRTASNRLPDSSWFEWLFMRSSVSHSVA